MTYEMCYECIANNNLSFLTHWYSNTLMIGVIHSFFCDFRQLVVCFKMLFILFKGRNLLHDFIICI